MPPKEKMSIFVLFVHVLAPLRVELDKFTRHLTDFREFKGVQPRVNPVHLVSNAELVVHAAETRCLQRGQVAGGSRGQKNTQS